MTARQSGKILWCPAILVYLVGTIWSRGADASSGFFMLLLVAALLMHLSALQKIRPSAAMSLLFIVMAFHFNPAAASTPSKKPPENAGRANATMANQTLEINGDIVPQLVPPVAKAAKEHPEFRRLIINSEGGFADSAIELAKIVRHQGWDVIVKHKCLSACANFVFPAGRRKFVLPNSWVGIHETRREFMSKDGRKYYVSGNEIADEMAFGNITPQSAEAARKRDVARRNFYDALGLSTTLLRDYYDYMTARKRVIGAENVNDYPGSPTCPRYRIWALNKKQLEEMGVTGIVDFWFPRTEAEKRSLYQEIGLPPGSIFIGESQELMKYCAGRPLNWYERMWLRYKPQRWN